MYSTFLTLADRVIRWPVPARAPLGPIEHLLDLGLVLVVSIRNFHPDGVTVATLCGGGTVVCVDSPPHLFVQSAKAPVPPGATVHAEADEHGVAVSLWFCAMPADEAEGAVLVATPATPGLRALPVSAVVDADGTARFAGLPGSAARLRLVATATRGGGGDHQGGTDAVVEVVVTAPDPAMVGRVVAVGLGPPGAQPAWVLVPLHGVTGVAMGDSGLATTLGRDGGHAVLAQAGPVVLDPADLDAWVGVIATSVPAAIHDRDRAAWAAVADAAPPAAAGAVRAALAGGRR